MIVSTDSSKYKRISVKLGAEVPFLRPKKYSSDNSVDYDYILHASKFLIKNKYYPDLIILLRPSTPNRITHVVDKAINFFIKNLKKYLDHFICNYFSAYYNDISIPNLNLTGVN